MINTRYKYIITSDWHIGSKVCEYDKLIYFLKHITTDVLILNGDIIDIDHTKRLNKKDWEILSLLRKMSKNTKIIYIRGNHDSNVSKTLSDLLGFEHCESYELNIANKRVAVVHGDEFDFFINKFWFITEVATKIYHWIQRFSTKKQVLARSLKRKSKRFIKCCDNIKKGAINYCTIKHYDVIICGHTHFKEDNENYKNCGCFTEAECSFISINKNDKIKLNVI